MKVTKYKQQTEWAWGIGKVHGCAVALGLFAVATLTVAGIAIMIGI